MLKVLKKLKETKIKAKPSDDKAKAASGDKGKTVKPSDDKTKTSPSDKGKIASKETKKK